MTLLLLLLNLNYGLERNALNTKFGDGFYLLKINTISNKKLKYLIVQSHIDMITILKDQVFSYVKDRIQDPTVHQKI